MSKSKGNVLDPLDLIDGITLEGLIKKRTQGLMQPKMAQKIENMTQKEFKDGIPSYGTDALRFTFCSLASYTREIRFDMNRLAGYRNFCNKLWNASRYVFMNIEGQENIQDLRAPTFSLSDRWILSRLQKTIQEAQLALSEYRFDLFAQTLYDFTWNEFCDWYLELSKPILTGKETSNEALNGTRFTLVYVLETLLRLLHPIIPYITEEIWQRIAPHLHQKTTSIMLAAYPQVEQKWVNQQAEEELNWLKNLIISIRTIRSEMTIPPGKLLPLLLRKGTSSDINNIKKYQTSLIALAKLDSITWLKPDEKQPSSASAFVNELELFIPFSGFINKEEEIERLQKEITKLNKEKAKLEILQTTIAKLTHQLEQIKG